MKGARDTGLHGSQMRGCQLLMADCLSVAPQDMPAGRRCDLIPTLMRGLYTYGPYADEAPISCRTSSVLVIMPSCLSGRPACLNEGCGLTGL